MRLVAGGRLALLFGQGLAHLIDALGLLLDLLFELVLVLDGPLELLLRGSRFRLSLGELCLRLVLARLQNVLGLGEFAFDLLACVALHGKLRFVTLQLLARGCELRLLRAEVLLERGASRLERLALLRQRRFGLGQLGATGLELLLGARTTLLLGIEVLGALRELQHHLFQLGHVLAVVVLLNLALFLRGGTLGLQGTQRVLQLGLQLGERGLDLGASRLLVLESFGLCSEVRILPSVRSDDLVLESRHLCIALVQPGLQLGDRA